MREEKKARKDRAKEEPGGCKGCYFWKKRKKECSLAECHFAPPEEKPGESKGTAVSCGDCPYGKPKPCIGYCLKKLLSETVGKRGRKGA